MLRRSKFTRLVAMTIATIAAIGLTGVVFASPGLSARGGGVVGGDPGLEFGSSTSQFGFTATLDGGQFQCLMAGRSGGFGIPDFGIESVLLMNVHGDVTPGTLVVEDKTSYPIHDLTVSGELATFSGTSKVTIVGETADGDVVQMVVELPYSVEVLEGGAGTGVVHLEHDLTPVGLEGVTLHTGGVLESGRINVSQVSQ